MMATSIGRGVRRVFVHHVSYTFMLPASKSLARNVICTNSPRDCVQKQHRSSGTTFKAVASSWRQLLWKPHQLNRICCQSSELHSKIQRTIQKDILGGITSSPRLTSKNSSLMDCLLMHIPDAHLQVKNCKELVPSSSRPSRFDQPIQASQWLKNFKITRCAKAEAAGRGRHRGRGGL
ncbi:uncharacterized protein LOC128030991 isoform X2 [Carassius gibelio]|uniref:uncharacterized protein LOC128030991 isoform X2 n=1 Tax=Carassius gibelio TaxID=101364 RepID=UPI0022797AD2|nr:uncharacterized protein LOC128030991 isoform X2 [Carassius gibelio]